MTLCQKQAAASAARTKPSMCSVTSHLSKHQLQWGVLSGCLLNSSVLVQVSTVYSTLINLPPCGTDHLPPNKWELWSKLTFLKGPSVYLWWIYEPSERCRSFITSYHRALLIVEKQWLYRQMFAQLSTYPRYGVCACVSCARPISGMPARIKRPIYLRKGKRAALRVPDTGINARQHWAKA